MDNRHVLARRGFLRLIAALPALAVFRSSREVQAETVAAHTFDSIQAQLREIVRRYPDVREIGMGGEAINCYEAGLIQRFGIINASEVARSYFRSRRVVLHAGLGPWDMRPLHANGRILPDWKADL